VPLQQVEVTMRNGYDIGIGVAAGTGSPLALGATGEVTAPLLGTGATSSFSFRRIDTTEELATELGISADVSGGVGLFSGSASFDFAKKCKIQASSLTVILSADRRFAFQQMDSPALSPAAAAKVSQPPAFAAQFGDYFVRGVATGGRFVGVVRIDTKSSQSKQDVNLALSASYGLSIDADVKVNISNALTKAQARVEAFMFTEGGTVTQQLNSNDPVTLMNQLFTAMDQWAATIETQRKAYSVTLAPYVIALGPEPPNLADLEHQRDVLTRCGKLRTQTLDKLNLIEYILSPDHMGEFAIIKPPQGPDLPALQAALAGDFDLIEEAASFALNNPKDAREPETFAREHKGIPDFKLTALPADLAAHTGGQMIVPDFVGRSFNDCHALADAAGIVIEHVFPPLLFDLKCSEQNFAPGLQIPPLVPVKLVFVNASLPPDEG
jgi:hypothetical protein